MIRIDDRIGSRELAKPLQRLGLPVKVKRMEFGDVRWTGCGPSDSLVTVAVERKKVSDLLACLQDNRFAGKQLPGLLNAYDRVYLLVEGLWRPDPKTCVMQTARGRGQGGDAGFTRRRFMYADFDGFIQSIRELGRIDVAFTYNERHTCFWLHSRYRWWAKAWSDHKSLRPMFKALHRKVREPGKDDEPEAIRMGRASVQRKMVAQIPGVLWDRSRLLEQHFGVGPATGIEPVYEARVKDLLQIEGIGPKTAGAIYDALHGAAWRRGR